MVGVDIPFPEPENPELVLDNNVDRDDLNDFIEEVMSLKALKEANVAK